MDWLEALRSVFGDGWLLLIAMTIYLVVNSGIIPKWLGDRRDEHARERADAAEERRDLIKGYETEAKNVRQWRAEDAEWYERRITNLEARNARQEEVIAKLAAAVESSERGNARLRHALNNVFQYISGMRDLAIAKGETPLQYNGWRTMLGISNDLDEQLRKLFDNTGEGSRQTPDATC